MARGKKFGRGRKGGNRGGNRAGGRSEGKDDRDNNEKWGTYKEIVQENEIFEKYYKEGGLIPENEWEEFWGTLKKQLPTTFRFTGSKGHADNVLATLKDVHIPHLKGLTWDGEQVEAPEPIAWYPEGRAYKFNVGKSTIRRCPPFKSFQRFLVAETSCGNISRQEEVSMIPPLFLDVQPWHAVLDMCAAPGSKTAQLMELLHAGEEAAIEEAARQHAAGNTGFEPKGLDHGRATGLIVANDVEYKRAHMLVHQTKRLNSPNIIITNNDATSYPSMIENILHRPDGSWKREFLKFDRVLADVPCSGDGTPRKNYNVWKDWKPNGAMNLHATQVKILIRGLQLLKPGGRIVYSTCSMNPIENEAVVAAAIERCGGADKVQLVDVSDQMPELKRIPGLKGGWKVMSNQGEWWNTYEDALASETGKKLADNNKLWKSWWYTAPEEEEKRVLLERTLRIYPHLQDTGGFYVAVLEKKADIKVGDIRASTATSGAATPAEEVKTEETTEEIKTEETTEVIKTEAAPEAPAPTAAPALAHLKKEDIHTPTHHHGPPDAPPHSPKKRHLEPVEVSPEAIAKRVKLEKESSPTPTPAPHNTEKALEKAADTKPAQKQNNRGGTNGGEEHFVYLAPDHEVLKEIYEFYHISPAFPRDRFLVRNAEGNPTRSIYYTCSLARSILTHNTSAASSAKFIHSGVKMFVKQDVQDPSTCRWRIQNEGMPILVGWMGDERTITATKRETVHTLLKELFCKETGVEEIKDRVLSIGMGCCVLKVLPTEGEDGFKDAMILPLWKSRHTINLMLPKEERKAMLARIFQDYSEILDSTGKNKQDKKDAEATEVKAEGEVEADAVEVLKEVEQEAAADADSDAEVAVAEEEGFVIVDAPETTDVAMEDAQKP
ncbi:S-adenosyl-L-methionine-dependent methyltransferase [Ascobolus immersus RN42]|uniref:S-adenosyl-L-methionine-dependent methyltransferase n=1 Tax=Ascobolus immersus RN42 TaxID=1160509 RepID=A0A3N4HSD8_ASCIM|nr:S-adenosyl-L-methionine-dependent methyltransferase [Ascobolus immersus RN42]